MAQILLPLSGGVLIGLAVTLMLWLNGRVTGISGIINGMLSPAKGDIAWRIAFVLGLFLGGLTINQVIPSTFTNTLPTEIGTSIVAGLLVGFGTVMGSGCTSGHGVCGISRLSPRSLVATAIFISAGILAVVVFRHWGSLV